MKYIITDNHIFIDTPFAQKSFVKEHLNGVWSQGKKMWRFPKTYWSVRELATGFPQLLEDTKFVELGKKLAQARTNVLQLKRLQDTTGDSKLRPYQRVDVAYLEKVPCAGIFNQPRMGKTPTSIVLMKQLGTLDNLVIAPSSLIWNWAKEFEKWYPEIHIVVYAGTPKQREKIQYEWSSSGEKTVLIISKDTWKKDYKYFEGFNFDTCFVDESHFLRNWKTGQSTAIYKVKAKRRYALTGTPTVKHPKDVWGILHFLYPDKFNSYWQFVDRYFYVGEDFLGHPEIQDVKEYRKQELEELIGFMSVQRKRKDVMAWLPDKEYINIPLQMEGKQQTLYKRMEDEFIAYLEDEEHSVDTPNCLSQLMRMRQLCLDPRLIGFDVRGTKTDALLEWLDDNRESVVIMSMFTSYLKLLKPEVEKLGLKVGEINGEVDNKTRMEVVSQFQSGRLDVLLCNVISAGVGLTVDRAETIIFTDKPWNSIDLEQAQDRILPTTKDRNHKVSIITFTCKDSVDYQIDKILDNKQSLTEVINNLQAIKNLLRSDK